MPNNARNMKIHCIIHASFEGPSFYRSWAQRNDHEVTYTHIRKNDDLPHPETFDLLLSMGGPQSALETEKYPYLLKEIKLIQDAIAENKFVLGVCLGAQLIGESLGARTEKSPHKEIGIFPIELTPEGKTNPMFQNWPHKIEVGHWHNDMPGLPDGATVLATSEGCPRQIIKFNDKTYGFQCHPEFTKKSITKLVVHGEKELVPGKYIQTAEEMLKKDLTLMNHHLEQFLKLFIGS